MSRIIAQTRLFCNRERRFWKGFARGGKTPRQTARKKAPPRRERPVSVFQSDACAVYSAAASAASTAPIMPLEEFVAPVTVSTPAVPFAATIAEVTGPSAEA